ncbi:MAG: hypothetical protein DBY20_04240 [Coriobacteriia bacterium]|nr:MAG: hypothetical protein DBY20_04240 [Coriobacteriia bacterium]
MRREDYGMRILLMNHFPLQGSGSGVYTINIARALVRKGHEVCIIMPENEELAELEIDGVRLHPVYFNSCVDDALGFDFPCFTTHPAASRPSMNLTMRRWPPMRARFVLPSKTRLPLSIPTSFIAVISGSRQVTQPITAYRS